MYITVAKTIATALVGRNLCYCNSLFPDNIALKDITHLQRVQHCLARVYTRSLRFSHSTPLVKCLHCLHILYRILHLPPMHLHQRTNYTYIHCSLLQECRGTFSHTVILFFLIPELKQISEPGIFMLPELCGTSSLSVLSQPAVYYIRKKNIFSIEIYIS